MTRAQVNRRIKHRVASFYEATRRGDLGRGTFQHTTKANVLKLNLVVGG